jgi:hypothetical protein
MSLLSPTPFESARAVFPINRSIRHVERAAKLAAHKDGSPWKRWDLLLFALLVGAQFRCKLLLIKDKRVKGIEPSFPSLRRHKLLFTRDRCDIEQQKTVDYCSESDRIVIQREWMT